MTDAWDAPDDPDRPDRPGGKGVHPVIIVGVLLAIVAAAWPFDTEPAEPAPGCRFVGRFQRCDTPPPSETSWDPAPPEDTADPYEDPFGQDVP
ncbi:hypothetical protein [Streptomyces phytophilus]|uniref:hypothetical protein n=1 Tax=Streptomyces phytophilus TaxID=722715 RepID=UPI0015F01397|nr:hypothetical protein [Streptomyces phytophilus]